MTSNILFLHVFRVLEFDHLDWAFFLRPYRGQVVLLLLLVKDSDRPSRTCDGLNEDFAMLALKFLLVGQSVEKV